jgi:predicted TIM-barrel fold metal-dependent hydrolase
MDSANKNLVIDADAHVVECARTWDFMDKSEQQHRPVPLETREEAGVRQQFWVIDGKVRGFRFPAFSDEELAKRQQQVGRKFADQQESCELGNVNLRLEYMDKTGVDVQVLHNTMFIESCAERPAVDVALCKSWNRWLGDIWRQSGNRLRWSCMPPLLSMPDALDQIRWSKENGAVAVCLRPVEGNRLLADPYFYPVYDQAQQLDMAIAIHIANGNPWLSDLYNHPTRIASTFHRFRADGGIIQRLLGLKSSSPNCALASSKPAPSGCLGLCTKPRTASKPWAARGRLTCSKSTACLSPAKIPTTCRISSRMAAKIASSSAPTTATWIPRAMSTRSRSSKSARISPTM